VPVLALFFCIGTAHVIYPDRFIGRPGDRKGGEMLIEFNRIGFQIVGIIVAVFAGCLLYMLVATRCETGDLGLLKTVLSSPKIRRATPPTAAK
jgi:hypothetical protein